MKLFGRSKNSVWGEMYFLIVIYLSIEIGTCPRGIVHHPLPFVCPSNGQRKIIFSPRFTKKFANCQQVSQNDLRTKPRLIHSLLIIKNRPGTMGTIGGRPCMTGLLGRVEKGMWQARGFSLLAAGFGSGQGRLGFVPKGPVPGMGSVGSEQSRAGRQKVRFSHPLFLSVAVGALERGTFSFG